ncbi:MAG: type II toxin-antitoxin system HicB family antitoxin [Methanobacteriota archaeon]
MAGEKYVYWEDNGMWVGYLKEFPDYMSQGETLEEFQDNLRDIYQDLCSHTIPHVRHVAELIIS